MSNAEWAGLFSTMGFAIFALVTTAMTILHVERNTNGKRLVMCFGGFITMIGGASISSALSRPPFEWISASQSAQATAAIVWCISLFVLAGVTWRAGR